jgi:hypothetical protein
LNELRKAGRNIASTWVRADGFIRYQHKFFHPRALILKYQLAL